MINISFVPGYVLPAGVPATAFTLQLGGGYTPAVNIVNKNKGDTLTNGSAWTPGIRVGETLTFDNEVFQSIVANFTGGSGTGTFLPRVLYYMGRGVLQVDQDGVPLTAKDVVNYTAP